MENIKISLGIPVYDTMKTETCYSLLAGLANLSYDIHLNFQKGTYLHWARNNIVAEAQKVGATHLMFVDGDIAFPPDGINRLLAHDKDIVGGAYGTRSIPSYSTVKMVDENGKLINYKWDSPPTELFKVFALGTGFLLIKMSVFDKIPKPYFDFDLLDGELVGEDVLFCKKVNDAGFEVWCDPTIKLGHIGEFCY